MNNLSYSEKQNLLAAVRIRFTQELDLPRVTAIQKIVERAIYVLTSESIASISVNNIMTFLHDTAHIQVHKSEVEKTLNLLSDHKAIEVDSTPDFEKKYFLSKENKFSIKNELEQSTRLFEKVSNRLFKEYFDISELVIVRKYFLSFLSKLFALFGNQWVKFQNGVIKSEEFIDNKKVNSIADELFNEYQFDDQKKSVIKNRIFDFFATYDPEYDQIKFNFGQSYYITQLLGYNSKVDLFSKSLFAASDMWLDTNIVLGALLIGSRHYKTFHTVNRLSKKLGINFYVSRKTILETLSVYDREKNILEQLYDDIPEEYLNTHTCRNSFLETYRLCKKQSDASKQISEAFKKFEKIEDSLIEHGINIIDNNDKMNKYFTEVQRYTSLFQSCSYNERNVNKSDSALEHDVLHYLLILEEKKYGKKIWLLTLDRSLPIVSSNISDDSISYCVLLDNLLQAISPYVDTEDEAEDFAAVFSEMIASQVLPKEQLFDLKDFLVFNQVGISCKMFSSEEIDDILAKVKIDILKGLNPHQINEEKRKEMMYWFEKYLAEHKVKQESIISAKENKIEELQNELNKQAKANEELVKTSDEQIDKFMQFKKNLKHIFISFFLFVIVMFVSFYFAKVSVADWNGYLFYISDFSWGSYIIGFVFWLIVLRFLLGSKFFNFLKSNISAIKEIFK